MDRNKIDACLEVVANKGCKAIWNDMKALDSGKTIREIQSLSQAEKEAFVKELKEIMWVYEGRTCS